MSGITTATVIAGIGAAATVASAGYSILSAAKSSKASAAAPDAQVNSSESTAMSARTNLLETAGGAAGSPLAPGQVGNSNNTIFGN